MVLTFLVASLLVAISVASIIICREQKIPESISAFVWLLKYKWFWTLWIWFIAITLGIPVIEILPDPLKAIGFLMISSLGFVGAMPLFEEELRTVHNFLGIAAGILSQICVLIINPWWLLVWIGAISLLILPNRYAVLISEVLCSISIYGCLFTSFLL